MMLHFFLYQSVYHMQGHIIVLEDLNCYIFCKVRVNVIALLRLILAWSFKFPAVALLIPQFVCGGLTHCLVLILIQNYECHEQLTNIVA
jgi:hypothetical protein